MPPSCRRLVFLPALLLLSHCAATPDDSELSGEPVLEKMEEAKLDVAPDGGVGMLDAEDAAKKSGKPAYLPAAEDQKGGLAPVTGKEGKFVIRDEKGAMRVQGNLKAGRMDGIWKYFDPTGRRLAEVSYLADERQGPITLFYVAEDGEAAGKKKMTGAYENGSLNGFAHNFHGTGEKYLERDFDHGILQGSRGWMKDRKEMTDGGAQSEALSVSRAEDALLSELEAFVQLKIRQNASTPSQAP